MNHIMREITPIGNDDFFVVLNHMKGRFDFPIHYHPEYELNMVQHFKGVRTVGDSVENVNAPDLVFIGPNKYHSWYSTLDYEPRIITVQFSQHLFSETFMNKNLFRPIKEMMMHSTKGLLFSQETIAHTIPRLIALTEKRGFDSVIDFFSIMYDLAIARDTRMLSSINHNNDLFEIKSRRIKLVCQYLQEHYHRKITIAEVAGLINMTESGFCHFFKKRTQKSFVDFLNDLRIGEASRMLLDTSTTISEISYDCGFNNISNFNRIFKKKKGVTPSEFRENTLNTMMVY